MSQPLRTGTNPVHVDTDPTTLLRLRRMARELRVTGQILSYDLDSLRLVEGSPIGAPAWTAPDGTVITIDVKRMPPLEGRRNTAIWLGTYAHELFHNLFTPRDDSRLMLRIHSATKTLNPGMFRAWNVLEDQRIERLGLARYEAWRGYLVACLSHHIPVNHPGSWALLAGRTWLPESVRAIARATFATANDEGTTRRVAELIGAYQRLADPGHEDHDEAYSIVDEFADLLGNQMPPKGGCGSGPIHDGEPESNDDDGNVSIPTADEVDDEFDDDGEPEHDEHGEHASDDESDDGDDDGDEDADGDGGGGEDDADADGDDDGTGEGDGSDEGDESDDDGDFGDDGDGSSDGESMGDDDGDGEGDADGDGEGDGASAESSDGEGGDGVSGSTDPVTVADALDEAIDEALGDEDTAADLDRVTDALDNGSTGGGSLPATAGRFEDATPAARVLARDLSTVLADIRDDCEAAWVRRTDSGRFSVHRWATDPDWSADDVFDLFDPGAMDASSLDVVLVLDISGSMSGALDRLVEAAWAIRTAIDFVEGECTVVGFGAKSSIIAERGKRPDGRMFFPTLEGSTLPGDACREAHRVVADSTATNRIVIVLTDGDWWDPEPGIAALKACKVSGATTCVVGLGSEARHVMPGFADADVVERIWSPTELVPIFRRLAETSMRAAAAGRI